MESIIQGVDFGEYNPRSHFMAELRLNLGFTSLCPASQTDSGKTTENKNGKNACTVSWNQICSLTQCFKWCLVSYTGLSQWKSPHEKVLGRRRNTVSRFWSTSGQFYSCLWRGFLKPTFEHNVSHVSLWLISLPFFPVSKVSVLALNGKHSFRFSSERVEEANIFSRIWNRSLWEDEYLLQ